MAVAELTAERVARNDATFRDANEVIAAAAADAGAGTAIPYLCECADPTCTALVPLTRGEYEQIRAHAARFLNLPAHQAAAGGWAVVVEHHESYVVVEKVGRAGEVAARLDPRGG